MENNLKNLPPFYVGQRVVCIKALPQSNLKEGEHYVIKQIKRGHCGYDLDIGFRVNPGDEQTKQRCICACIYEKEYGVWFFDSSRFAPLTESPFPSLTFKEVIEKEKVLTCNN